MEPEKVGPERGAGRGGRMGRHIPANEIARGQLPEPPLWA